MTNKLVPFFLIGASLVAGCDSQQPTTTPVAPKVDKADAVASVNGVYISKTALQELEKDIAERTQGQSFPKDKLIEELVQRELLVQEALQKQLDKSPEFIQRMDVVRKSLLSQAALQNYLKSNPVTDEEIKAEYEKNVGGENNMEYKARHILVKTEDEAKKIIAQLDKGAKFDELAKKTSTGPSGPEGGDLGWFAPSQMVTPFSEAVIALENGKYTSEPVETQFGWHVILREDSRQQTMPALEEVKEQITPYLQRQKVQTMMENLRAGAQVEILIPIEAPAAPQLGETTAPEAEMEAAPAEESPAADQPASEKPTESLEAPAAQ
ncbi:peptidylprolyl isomerase [Methylotuvimicrobium alcaliphilum]|uniref:peptidylprolyl isomerase n=1 Tax=Methylotuvimicrobium alcaliphilum (strain DSM 19304 / NCIMB 14124 / VKM B-2133 / 20Z) TaxID=1091494 RepID=G4T1U2_META2|nr:peptidylprolyl isomerase [Methylotuvimicrobium alcaliphilum]CCE23524.1 PpiC-type peptidyl-prolyl cis-trans isomerase [Methylotuvimicrobium alcaliphilum 20Z]